MLNQLSLSSNINMEKLGIEPKFMICKIKVLPIKLYPLFHNNFIFYINLLTYKGIEPLYQQWKCRVLTIGRIGLKDIHTKYPKNDLNVYD
jgi:hypothetical protein